MALNAYLRLKSQKQGEIKGSVTQKGREGTIAVIAASHELASPRDAATGLPTGKRQHHPLTLTKELDRATPLLLAALVSNEAITGFTLDFYAPTQVRGAGTGTESNVYSIVLENAAVASSRLVMLNTKDPALQRFALAEELTFTYEKITWTWHDGDLTATDDWSSVVD
jgi:type VI secretion system secreted protein Hcp